ncbi:EAL domain-containing protein, partial [Massilia arenosa]
MSTRPPALAAEILVVEDSATQARALATVLEENAFVVRLAADGQAGLASARAQPPSLVVSDIAMPGMDGFAMCRALKADPATRDIPVILLTALNSLYDVIRGLDCGADNFIRKPFDPRYLVARIEFILANRRFRPEERVQLGMQVNLGGQTHFITAERQQIFDLLISTYEEAIHMTEELRERQDQIARSYQSLDGLYRTAHALNGAVSADDMARRALDAVLELPGVTGAAVLLRAADGALQPAAIHNVTLRPDCTCPTCLLDGSLRTPQRHAACPANGDSPYVCLPLLAGERELGLLNLRLSADDLDLNVLSTVGAQLASALERADLYANMEALVRERTEALDAERNLFSTVVKVAGALVCLVDAEGAIKVWNPACEQTLGWRADEVLGRSFWELAPERAAQARERFARIGADRRPMQFEEQWDARDGTVRHILWTVAWLPLGAQGDHYLGTGIDLTALYGVQEKLEYANNFDPVTGLPNRLLLRDRVQQRLVSAGAAQAVGLLCVRVGDLHRVRELLGRAAEETLLAGLADRLRELARPGDAAGRVTDDTFQMVAVRASVEELAHGVHQLLARLDEPFAIDGNEVHVEAVAGLALYPNDGADFDQLAQSAELAARQAMRAPGQRYAFYRPELNEGAQDRFRLESALRRAVERDELCLHYQPQVALATGRVIGVEALVRWRHPELGMVPPGRFIGLAEESGLITAIGAWVLRTACEQLCAWQRAGLAAVPVSVNISARQFNAGLPDQVAAVLAETGLDPAWLELELTETASMDDPAHSMATMRRLKDLGVRLAIDDFGTGYSNLNYLKRFPVDRLKLDQSFVRDLTSDPDDLAIAEAVIAMAHGLRLTVIAEGVETAGQLALLARHGCDEMQGYLFSRPLEPADCAALLREGRGLPAERLRACPYARTVLVVDDAAAQGTPIASAVQALSGLT